MCQNIEKLKISIFGHNFLSKIFKKWNNLFDHNFFFEREQIV